MPRHDQADRQAEAHHPACADACAPGGERPQERADCDLEQPAPGLAFEQLQPGKWTPLSHTTVTAVTK